MKKSVIVKKNKSHLYGIRFMLLLFVLAAVVMVMWAGKSAVYIAPICGIFLVPTLVLELYFETWKIAFSGEKISARTLFVARTYEWRELKETKSYYSFSENGETLAMLFKSGKSLRFCLKDQNAEEAVKLILKHCNIQNV